MQADKSEFVEEPLFLKIQSIQKNKHILALQLKNIVYYFERQNQEGFGGRNFEGLLLRDGQRYEREGLCASLQKYVDELLGEKEKPSNDGNKHVPTVAKINHLRDALVANMVGVISHLQQHYPGNDGALALGQVVVTINSP